MAGLINIQLRRRLMKLPSSGPATYTISDLSFFSQRDVDNMVNGLYGGSWNGGCQANDNMNYRITFSRPVLFQKFYLSSSHYDMNKGFTLTCWNGSTQIINRSGGWGGTSNWVYNPPVYIDQLYFSSPSRGYAMWRTGYTMYMEINYL